MAITVVPYTPGLRPAWDTFVRGADNAVFLFERDFMEYHSDRFTDASSLVYDDGHLVAVFPANVREHSVYSHQGLTYGGLVMEERRNVKKMLSYFHHVFSFYRSAGMTTMIYKPVPDYFCRTVNDLEHFILNSVNAGVKKVDTGFVIDYRNEIRYQERRKRSLKKGEKNNAVVRMEADLSAFWNEILIPNLRDKFGSAPVHTLAEIQLLHERFPERIRQANAYINEQLVAGATLFDFGNTIHCQYISSNDFGRDSGAIDLLFDHLIHAYKADKLYFSLGTANNSGNDINLGLSEWKEGWSAKIRAHFHYQFDLQNSKALEKFVP